MPGLANQIGEIDLASTRPRTLYAGHYVHPVFENDFNIDIIADFRARTRCGQRRQHEIDRSMAEIGKFVVRTAQQGDFEIQTRIAARKLLDNRGKHRAGEYGLAADAQLACRGVGEMLDFPHSLSEFIERGCSAFKQCIAIDSWLDAAGTAVQQLHADRRLQICDGLGYGGLRHAQKRGGFRHAARLYNRKENMEVPQSQAPADAAFPIDSLGCGGLRYWGLCHEGLVIPVAADRWFHLYVTTAYPFNRSTPTGG